jgi:threonyl-tRNA synthetase
MAQVLEQMYPGVKLTLGPAISNGFYYDIDFEDQKITEADFKERIAFLRFQEENMNLNYVLCLKQTH